MKFKTNYVTTAMLIAGLLPLTASAVNAPVDADVYIKTAARPTPKERNPLT